MGLYFPKPEPRKREKARRRRREREVVGTVRGTVELRDGHCRFRGCGLGPCRGASAWAHFGEKKRFKTRGMPPEERHTTAGSLMLCNDGHHWAYDRGEMAIEALTDRGCDGPLRATRDGIVYEEPA